MESPSPSPPPAPATKRRGVFEAVRPAVSMAVFVGVVWWLTGGGTHAARFWWVLGALLSAPIVLYLLFLGAIVVSALRRARRKS
ncbi:MAG: hypothetical protein ABJD97_03445 [Betaproteobacteria bacterium]